MTVLVFIFAVICLTGMKIAGKGEYFKDYIDKDRTAAIEGIFVGLVFFRHYEQYISMSGPFDAYAKTLDSVLGQLIVAMFLFYSGYGIMESIKRKSMAYVKQIPVKCLKLLIHYDIAILLFLVEGLILGNRFSAKRILLSLVCWESLGNSNWYIMAILAVYLLTYLAFRFLKDKHHFASAVLLVALCLAYIVVVGKFKAGYWVNTVMVYPLGLFYSLFKEKIEKFVTYNSCTYAGTLMALVALFHVFFTRRGKHIVFYECWAMVFALIVILVTMKFSFGNGILEFLGAHVFSIYILQRLPMRIMDKLGNMNSHSVSYFVIAFMVTVFISLVFDYLMSKLDGALFKAKKPANEQ